MAQDAPYAEAVRWAASERLIFGCGGGRFGPDDPVTSTKAERMIRALSK